MFDTYKYKILIVTTLSMLVLSACGSAPQTEDQIATAVQQTVQAQQSLTKIANLPTLTPAPTIEVTAASPSAATNTPAPVVGAPGCAVSAQLTGETPPDGTLVKPGENFWKTWSLENTGTCTWDQTYKLVYVSGELMGGLTSYPLPEMVAPGEAKQISIYLKAPEAEGQVTGYWQLQTPWNTFFGVGPASSPFYVQVVVSNSSTQYGITSVTYEIIRDPATDCPANVRYTVRATITTNGPYEFQYYWDQSDGNESSVKSLNFTEAGSKIVSRDWLVGRGDSPNPRWMQIIVTEPIAQEYDRAVFLNNCP